MAIAGSIAPFGRAVETRVELEEAVAIYASHAAEKLRGQGLATKRITVFANTNRFKPEGRQTDALAAIRRLTARV